MSNLSVKDWYMLYMMDFDMDPMDLAKELKIFSEKRRMYNLFKGKTPPNLYGTDKPGKPDMKKPAARPSGGCIRNSSYSEAMAKSDKLNKDKWWED